MDISLEDFLQLRHDLCAVDVRSPGEYTQGHIRNAINIPLLNDEERVQVGTDYKQKGQQEAIRTGFRLVGPRLEGIIDTAMQEAHGREMLVHCWRGGMRSRNFSQFVGMAGVKTRTLTGGYKTYRTAALESYSRPLKIVLLTGCTGSGKSEILRALRTAGEQILDLEDLAHHKGSAFGGLLQLPQPSTEQFQNELFEEIMGIDPLRRVWIEDESIAIGKIFLPKEFWQQMAASPLVQMDVHRSVRVQRLVHEYGPADQGDFLAIMRKIVKKLGGQNLKKAEEFLAAGDMSTTIDILLTYYDKAYLSSIDKRRERIKSVVRWDGADPLGYARELIRLNP
jgi:tRNA 2-selenouridine synthase